jgi:signal transduction histidine kinase
MRQRRLPLRVLVPIGLVLLVGSLAVLQYRWLGQVSQAERDSLRTSLAHSADEFALDFDHEISEIFITLQQVDGSELEAGNAEGFARRFDQLRDSARFPDLVETVYFARDDGDEQDVALQEYSPDSRQFVDADWPEELKTVRDRLRPNVEQFGSRSGSGTQVFEFALSPVISDIPALMVPVHAPGPLPAGDFERNEFRRIAPAGDASQIFLNLRVNRSVLVALLDTDYLRESMLPTLAERHFPAQAADRFRVSIVDRDSAPILDRGLPEGATIAEDEADVTTTFFGVRLNTVGSYSTGSSRIMAWQVTRADGSNQPADLVLPQAAADAAGRIEVMVDHGVLASRGDPGAAAIRLPRDAWQLRLQHVAGSLDAAVSNARTRNLWLSFGILAMLGASVGLIVLNARRSERLAAQQMDFVATVSHELRTPLAVIRSAAQNLSAGVVLDEGQAQRYGDLIEGEGRRLTDMIEQVLEFAGLSGNRQLLRAQPVDVRSLVGDVLSSSKTLLDAEDFEVSLQVDGDLPAVVADGDALRRALQNLISNAVKYAAEGRWIGISARLASNRGAREVELAVSDRGRGIDAEDLPHIFEPFYRGRYAVDRQIHGNGLGLSLVKRIAEAHGGRLVVQSAAGEGTTFTISLPALAGEPTSQGLPDPAPETGGPPA